MFGIEVASDTPKAKLTTEVNYHKNIFQFETWNTFQRVSTTRTFAYVGIHVCVLHQNKYILIPVVRVYLHGQFHILIEETS